MWIFQQSTDWAWCLFLCVPFGIQLPLAPLTLKSRAAFQALTFPQYFWVCGILYCGGGLFIMTIFSRYLEWKYWHGRPLTIETLYRDIVQNALLSGTMFGVVGGLTRSGNNTK